MLSGIKQTSWTNTVGFCFCEVPTGVKVTDREQNGAWQELGERGEGGYCLMHMELLFGTIKRFWV